MMHIVGELCTTTSRRVENESIVIYLLLNTGNNTQSPNSPCFEQGKHPAISWKKTNIQWAEWGIIQQQLEDNTQLIKLQQKK